jgi:hypothetical protein
MLTTVQILEKRHKDLMAKKKAGDETPPEAGFLKYLSRYIVSLAARGFEKLQAQNRVPSYEEIMSHDSTFNKYTEDVLRIARRLVRDQMAHLRQSTAADPRHKLGRSVEMWEHLVARLLEEIEGEELFAK